MHCRLHCNPRARCPIGARPGKDQTFARIFFRPDLQSGDVFLQSSFGLKPPRYKGPPRLYVIIVVLRALAPATHDYAPHKQPAMIPYTLSPYALIPLSLYPLLPRPQILVERQHRNDLTRVIFIKFQRETPLPVKELEFGGGHKPDLISGP